MLPLMKWAIRKHSGGTDRNKGTTSYRKKLLKREKERKSAATASGTGFVRNSRAGGVNEEAVNYVYKNIFRNFTGG